MKELDNNRIEELLPRYCEGRLMTFVTSWNWGGELMRLDGLRWKLWMNSVGSLMILNA